MRLILTTFLTVSLSAGCFAFSKKPAPEVSVAFETILTGQHSSIDTAAAFSIDNEKQWQNMWKLAQGQIDPMPDAPVIDFSKNMVLAVFMGQKTSGGHAIEITKLTKSAKILEVEVSRYSGGGGTMLPVLTSPYHLVQIAKGDFEIKIVYLDRKEK